MTVKILRALLAVVLVISLSSSSFASQASETVNNFAFSAAKLIMGRSDDNFFFSPFSVVSAFSMLYAGAKGETAREIESSLGVTGDIHASLGELAEGLYGSGNLTSANRVWIKDGLKLRRQYTETLRKYYGSSVKELDFKGRTEGALKEINGWVSAKTNGKIRDLLRTLNPDTGMILTNAVYFSAEWRMKFSREMTKDGKFFADDGTYKEVPMMRQRNDFRYIESGDVKAVMLPYEGYSFSMVVILPAEGKGEVLRTLDAEKFGRLIDGMSMYDVDLMLPKFRSEKRYELKEIFRELGVVRAFGDGADFSGITRDEPLRADEVIHQSFIEVDEERTEAAAATAVVMLTGTAVPVERPFREFHAERPFLYFVRDNESGTVLFMGYQSFK